MTPESDYDPVFATSLLNEFPDATLDQALKELRENHFITKAKNMNERRIPGRAYHLSDKFFSALVCASSFIVRLVSCLKNWLIKPKSLKKMSRMENKSSLQIH